MHRRPVKGGTGWDCKANGAKAAGLYFEIANVGKVVEASKKRITWRIKMQEGKEYEISLTHSIASGKKVLRIDGIVTHQTSTYSLGDWDYCFNLGNHVIHCIIKPSVELNDSYDLIVDGISFRRLPEQPIVPKAEPVVRRNKDSLSRESSASDMNSRTDSASGPWECTTCTLINEKPLAPICEACGAPKPKFPVIRQAAPQKQTPTTFEFEDNKATQSHARNDSKNAEFNPFGASAPAATSWVDFDKPPVTSDPFSPPSSTSFPNSSQPAVHPSENIASMLHGLDFNYSPPPPAQQPTQYEPEVIPRAPEAPIKAPVKSIRSMQSMEQARLATNGSSKQLVMPPPPSYQTYTAAPQGSQIQQGFGAPQHILVPPPAPNQFASYNMQPAMGSVQPRAPQQQFISNMTNVPPPQTNKPGTRPNLADPFATLS